MVRLHVLLELLTIGNWRRKRDFFRDREGKDCMIERTKWCGWGRRMVDLLSNGGMASWS